MDFIQYIVCRIHRIMLYLFLLVRDNVKTYHFFFLLITIVNYENLITTIFSDHFFIELYEFYISYTDI